MSAKTLEDLARCSNTEVRRLFESSSVPDPNALVDWEFRGYNLPLFTKLAGFQKFKKGFYRQGDEVWGYNIPVAQGSLEKAWDCRPSNEDPKRFGFYRVSVVGAEDANARVAPAILLNYAPGRNGLFEGSFLRDYVRQVDEDNDDLHIGKAYSSIGGTQVLPTFFIIERDREAPTPVAART